MGISKRLINFDPSAPTEHDRIGSFVLGAAGTVITETGTALDVNIANASIVVTATDLDIRDLAFATDSVTAHQGGTWTVGVNSLPADIDIRDLINTQDSVAIGDETNLVDMQQEDAAWGTTPYGFPIFGVRQDASGSPVSADGDAHPLVFNNDGELKTSAELRSDIADDAADSGNPIKIGGRGVDQGSALSALSAGNDRFDLLGDLYRRVWINESYNVGWTSVTVPVGTTAAQLDGTKQAGRKKVIIQNQGDKAIFVGPTNAVTTATGTEIPKFASLELELGEALDVYAIGATGASAEDIRVLQAG